VLYYRNLPAFSLLSLQLLPGRLQAAGPSHNTAPDNITMQIAHTVRHAARMPYGTTKTPPSTTNPPLSFSL